MRIYTKTGDEGETGLFAGSRVPKDHARIEAYGTVDELNAALGQARTEQLPDSLEAILTQVQHDLFAVGAELATPHPEAQGTKWHGQTSIGRLEMAIDQLEQNLPALRQFILPFGHRAATSIHLARAVCRRAERRVVTLARKPGEKISREIIIYLNRLGDLLFVAARAANAAHGIGDVPWVKRPFELESPAEEPPRS
jgi:cob(I)alamin adenosyltransferase